MKQLVNGRSVRVVVLALIAIMSLVLSACGAKANAPAAGEKFVFGLVLVGPINDGGWSQAHYDAAKYVESKIPGSEMVYVDKVNPADRPNVKVEQVVDELIAKGAKLIITTSDDFKDGTRESAKAHPDVTFIHASGDDVLTGKAPANLGNVMGSRGDWSAARSSFSAAAEARPGFAMARSSAALAAFQLGDLDASETELRRLIRRYPLFADARAALTALLWRRGASGEAESHWASASGLDPRYRQPEWLLEIRRWPPEPVSALNDFLALAVR